MPQAIRNGLFLLLHTYVYVRNIRKEKAIIWFIFFSSKMVSYKV